MATGWYKSKPSRPGDMKIAEAYLAEAVEAMASESRWFVKEWQAVRLLQRELIIYIYTDVHWNCYFMGPPLFKHSKRNKLLFYVCLYMPLLQYISIKSLLYVVC